MALPVTIPIVISPLSIASRYTCFGPVKMRAKTECLGLIYQ